MSDRIIFMLIGVLVGGIAGSVLTSRLFGKDYKKRIEELESENKQLVAREKGKKTKELSDKEKKTRVKEAELDKSIAKQVAQAREERQRAEEKVREQGYLPLDGDSEDEFDTEEEPEFDDPFEESDGEETVIKTEKPKEPSFRRMTQEDYESDFEYRDSEALTWYQEDHVLADAFDDRVGNPENVIGEEAVTEADSTDENYIYVLDEVEDKMYEIEINHEDSYYRDVVRSSV